MLYEAAQLDRERREDDAKAQAQMLGHLIDHMWKAAAMLAKVTAGRGGL